jgi:hypothetical protein
MTKPCAGGHHPTRPALRCCDRRARAVSSLAMKPLWKRGRVCICRSIEPVIDQPRWLRSNCISGPPRAQPARCQAACQGYCEQPKAGLRRGRTCGDSPVAPAKQFSTSAICPRPKSDRRFLRSLPTLANPATSAASPSPPAHAPWGPLGGKPATLAAAWLEP